MGTAVGGFIGELDENLQLNDAYVHVPTRKAELTARNLRVKILQVDPGTREGRVSAIIRGANGSLARNIYPQYEAFWDLRRVPAIPLKMDEGRVKDAPFLPGARLPEIESFRDGAEAKPIPLDHPVTSEGFIVQLSLTLVGFEPGTKIRGVVALSDK